MTEKLRVRQKGMETMDELQRLINENRRIKAENENLQQKVREIKSATANWKELSGVFYTTLKQTVQKYDYDISKRR